MSENTPSVPARFNWIQRVLGVLVACFMGAPFLTHGDVVINEIMASNGETVADEDGDFEDWVELYNTGSSAISLEGWGLSDDEENPEKWFFPAVTIGAGEHLLVWASGKDRAAPGGPLHTNFSIAAGGEALLLTRVDGSTADLTPAIAIDRDLSWGRTPDGGEAWLFFSQPSPGAGNEGEGFAELLQAPVLSHVPGFYPHTLTLSVHAPDSGVTLRYTLDGSEPTEQSPVYSGAIRIEDRSDEVEVLARINSGEGFQHPSGRIVKGTVVRVRAFRADALASPAATGTYFIGPQFQHRWDHPVISLAVNFDDFFGPERGIYVRGNVPWGGTENWNQRGIEWEREVNFEFFETDGAQVLNHRAGARVHGGASRARAKKSLRLYARSDYGTSAFEHAIFPDQPYASYERLLLRNGGNDADRSILRDGFMQGLVDHMRFDTQAYRPAIVFINGEYWGIHNIRERYDDNYIERVHGVDPADLDYLAGNMEVEYGDRNHYQELSEYIRANDTADPVHYAEIGRRMDLDNFLDYQVAQIYLNNTDWPGNNIDFWRMRTEYDPDAPEGHDGRWRWLLYDTDFGYNLYWEYNHPHRHENHNTLAFATTPNLRDWPNPDWSTLFLRELLKNEEFRNGFINRMADQLNTGFKPNRALALLTEYWDRTWPGYPANPASPAHNPDFEERRRWRMIADWALPRKWEGMSTFAERRPDAVRSHLQSHFDLADPYALTIDVAPAGSGRVRVNTVDIGPGTMGLDDPSTPFPWTGTYFRDVPVTLEPVAAPGFTFVGWSGTDASGNTISVTANGDLTLTARFEAGGNAPEIVPHVLAEGDFAFLEWHPDEPEGSFPAHMRFLQSEQSDPMLADPVDQPYAMGDDDNSDPVGFPYNNTSRTRINGLGERGISFINTGRDRDVGAAVVALDTRAVNNATLQWEASTETPNSRVYAIRLQYRVGDDTSFRDFPAVSGGVIEYRRSAQAGVSQVFGPHPLPGDALNQPYVELRWKYYFTGRRLTQDSGARDEIRLDNIIVRDGAPSFERWQEQVFPVPSDRDDPTLGGPLATPYGDGVPNLLRYALGMPPTDDGWHLLPFLRPSGASARVELSLHDPKPDILYVMEASGDLVEWVPLWDSENAPETVTDRLSFDVDARAPEFIRLRVELEE